MRENINIVRPEDLKHLTREFEVLTFVSDTDLVYEDHVPLAGIVLLEGILEMVQDGEVHLIVKPPHILGVANMLHEIPSNFGCRIKANSKVILLGKSKILDILRDKRSHLFRLLKRMVPNAASRTTKI
jgi:hypothetical protein